MRSKLKFIANYVCVSKATSIESKSWDLVDSRSSCISNTFLDMHLLLQLLIFF